MNCTEGISEGKSLRITEPSLAILVLTYRSTDYICETMISVMRAVESCGRVSRVYVSDDASEDHTDEAVRACWQSSVPLSLHVNVSNIGESANVNVAFDRLKNDGVEWAILLHGDDHIHPSWPGIVAKSIRTAPDGCGMICCANAYAVENEHRQFGAPGHGGAQRYFPGVRESIGRLGKEWFLNISGTAINVDAWIEIGGFHPEVKYAGDNDFIVRFFIGGHGVLVLPGIYVNKRAHSQSVTCQQIRSGEFAVGWAHLMHRYLWLTTKAERSRNYVRQCYGIFRNCLAATRRADWTMAWGQFKACRVMVQSWVALLLGWDWLIPARVRRALAYQFPYQKG